MEITAFIISILAFLLSVYQFLKESSREKKEATLNAYKELQNEVFYELNKYPDDLSKIEYQSEEWEQITNYLVKIENFCVGINSGIYSIKILNRLGGAYFIRQYKRLRVIIDVKCYKDVSHGKHYDEFEKTILRIKKYRSKSKED